MRRDNLAKLTGLRGSVLDAPTKLVIYIESGHGPEKVGTATTLSEAIDVITASLFADGPPDYPKDAPEYAPGDEYADESVLVRALGYELSEQQCISRTFSAADLVHLTAVQADPTLELVVAWEAQEFAVGVFRQR